MRRRVVCPRSHPALLISSQAFPALPAVFLAAVPAAVGADAVQRIPVRHGMAPNRPAGHPWRPTVNGDPPAAAWLFGISGRTRVLRAASLLLVGLLVVGRLVLGEDPVQRSPGLCQDLACLANLGVGARAD